MYNWCNFAGQLLQMFSADLAYNDDQRKYESFTREEKHLNFGFVQPSTTIHRNILLTRTLFQDTDQSKSPKLVSCILLTKAFFSFATSSGSHSIVDPTCSASFWSVSQEVTSDDWESVPALSPDSLKSAILAAPSLVPSGGISKIKDLEFSPLPWQSVAMSSSSIRHLLGLFSRVNLSLISLMTGLGGELWSRFNAERSSSANSWIRGFSFASKLSPSSSIRGFLWQDSE